LQVGLKVLQVLEFAAANVEKISAKKSSGLTTCVF